MKQLETDQISPSGYYPKRIQESGERVKWLKEAFFKFNREAIEHEELLKRVALGSKTKNK